MRAVIIDGATAGRDLRIEQVPEPAVGENDLLVAVRTAGVNRADLRRAVTHFAASDQATLPIAGLELAGEVIAMGGAVSGFAVGDRIMAMAGAAYAERAAVDHRLVAPVPEAMDWETAAATTVSFITAHDALVSVGSVARGETVLVQGASSGAGIAAVQIARFCGAKTIFGTAGTTAKLRRLQSLGCDVAIDYRKEDVVEAVRSACGGGVDVTVDFAGGETLQKSIAVAAVRGRIVCAGRVAGSEATFSLDEFSPKQIQMTGVTNRTRSLEERIRTVRCFVEQLMPALADGTLKPVVDSVYPLDQASEAQEHMRSNTHFGKIVLAI